jgi:hypothetical protein
MTRRAVLGAVLLVLALGIGACGGESTSETSQTTTTQPPATTTEEPSTTSVTTSQEATASVAIVVRDGKAVGGIKRVKVDRGQKVTLVVSSDIADEVHLHGYDLMADAAPGEKARIVFVATIPGRFEVELETRGLQIGELEVRP